MILSFDINTNIFRVKNTAYKDRTILWKLGFKWDDFTRTWSSTTIGKAFALYDCADDTAKETLDKHSQAVGRSIDELKAIAIEPEMVRLIKETDTFYLKISYEERGIASGAGFTWDRDSKRWMTKDVDVAIKLAAYAGDDLRNFFEEYQNEKAINIDRSQSVNSEIEIPVPTGLAYLPYQRGGIAYGSSRPNTLIADEMGLGKTIQAIGICNMDASIERVLIVCPASLKINWLREFKKWDVKSLSVAIATSDMFPMANVVIINYDILKKHDRYIHQTQYDILIVDEAHYLKNPKAKRTIDVFGDKEKNPIQAKRKIFLTGTPITNKPIEAWTLCHNLAPTIFPDWFKFSVRYCNGHRTQFGWDTSGSSNLDELQHKLRGSIMVRRLKSEVLKELPKKRRQIIELGSDEVKGILKKEREAFSKLEANMLDRQAEALLAIVDDEESYKRTLARFKHEFSVGFEEMSKIRKEVAMAKIPFVISHLESAIECGKVVCFAHHHEVIDKIKGAFPKAVVVTGSTKIEERQRAVDAFQNDPSVNLFIGNIIAAGVGLTLTASSHVVFVELDWVPGNVSQCEDRCHRIGQLNSVLVQHLILEGSTDVRMARTLIRKQEIIEQALDNPEEVTRVSLGEKISSIAKEGIDPLDLENAVSPPHLDNDSRVIVNPKSLLTEISHDSFHDEFKGLTITGELTESIHRGLRLLASSCDGAFSRDKSGFNKIDVRVGKSLAEQNYLSPKQVALGRKLLLKYHRQLPSEINELIRSVEAK
ncbi:MAG TPA: DEAD/DEAH box helicase [Cyclobacteriaceae bacterium]|jgi:SWI/SNF-related matrix-associated actin-dependent regulator 1 of chromatin subfamily A|nr:DEAD/DEAH box helicase [Cyclobacteriaceae bacterium]